MSEKLKKLTSKNPKDFEPVANSLINDCDIELFTELVEKEDFLFDFVKQNVAQRLAKQCNSSNYLNLLQLLKCYSPAYEDFIVSALVKYADEDLTDKMLEIFENGTVDEKTYCAKFFSYIRDPLSIELLNKYAFNENANLSSNCASTLAVLQDEVSYNRAFSMLDDEDEFTRLDGVRFLISYGKVDAVDKIVETMKKSSISENIAGELPYLMDLLGLYEKNHTDCLYVVNCIVNGLGEILGLAQVFDFRLYEFFEMLIKSGKDSEIAVLLLNAIDKFNTLTENDEYLFDETKDTKQEILDIKNMLNSIDAGELYCLIDNELKPESLFVYTAMEFTENESLVRKLVSCNNPTIVLRALEVLKQMGSLTQDDKSQAINAISDENLKSIILAI